MVVATATSKVRCETSARLSRTRNGETATIAAATGGGAPDPERDIALAAFAERRREDRQRRRREQRPAEPLHRAEDDEGARGPRESGEQRAQRERRDACDQQAPPAEEVGEPSSEQEHAAEEYRVGGDHPLQARLGEVQIRLDGREGDVHDRDV